MKLCTFYHGHKTRIGVVSGDSVIDLAQARPHLPQSMTAFLAGGAHAMAEAREASAAGRNALPLSAVTLLAPVPRPGKVLAIGMNYADHIRETNRPVPEHQIWFQKQAGAITGPSMPVAIPAASSMIDFEGELVYVIGRRCRRVPAARAMEVIAGFMIGNDVTVRDWQARSPTMMMGKGFDTHGPTGPWLTTADEIADPHALTIRTWVNGALMQSASTAEMIFKIAAQIEHLSTAFTLEPGDVIFTGTPAGVGVARKPPVFLKAGDVVRVEIEGLGAIENTCAAEPDDTLIA